MMQCPVCKTKHLEPVELEDRLTAAGCGGCGGRWVSRQAYDRWLKGHGDTLPEKPFSEVSVEVGEVGEAKICPDCGRILLKYKAGHGLDFFVDHCGGCGGVWLDRNEWDALRERNLHDEIHRVFSTSWQAQVRGEAMREKLDAVYAARFGAETYGRLKETREWLHEHPQRLALLAFLSDEDPYRL
jgi:Zn-finger nucleic acid-binding protein